MMIYWIALFKILNLIICLSAVLIKNEAIKFQLTIFGGIGIMIQFFIFPFIGA